MKTHVGCRSTCCNEESIKVLGLQSGVGGAEAIVCVCDRHISSKSMKDVLSGVTERLGALGHIDTRGPFTTSPVTLMSRAGLTYVGRVCTVLVGPPAIKNQ